MEGLDGDAQPPARLPFDGLIADVLRDAASATRREARAEVERSGDRVGLEAGHHVGSLGSDRVWSFSVVGEHEAPPETPGQLVICNDPPVPCRLLATGTGTVLLSVRADLGRSVPRATLSTSAGFVHQRLAERLEDLAVDGTDDPSLVEALIHPDPDPDAAGLVPLDVDEDEDEDEQELAVRRAVDPGLRFTWGPPGTGKTGVLARAVALAVEQGYRVLVVAHANAAVDVATARIAEVLEGTDELTAGRILRVGTPHRTEALDRHDVLPERIVADRFPELAERRRELEQERRSLSDAARDQAGSEVAARLAQVRIELAELGRQLDEAQRGLLANATVVVTTLAKVVIDDDVWRWPADIVVVDEASMAPYPMVLALAARGATTLSCVGDFRQLPPIAISQDPGVRHWFAQDVFAHAAVTATYEAGGRDDRMTALRTQYRMGEVICATISDLAYDGALSTAPAARNRAIRLAERWPGEGAEVVIVDTSRLDARCESPAAPDDRSRFSPISAAVAVAVAQQQAAQGTGVGIVSPYRAQVELLHAAARSQRGLTTGTIHRFQGSERDVIVYDLVDAPGGDGASRLTGSDRDLSRRLANVAASRARGKLLVIAHLGFLTEAHAPSSASRRLIELATEHGADTVDAVDLIDDLPGVDAPVVRWHPSRDAAAATVLNGRADPRVEVRAHPEVVERWCDAILRVCPDADVVQGRADAALRPRPGVVSLSPGGPEAGVAVVDDAALLVGTSTDFTATFSSPAAVAAYRRLTSPT